MEYPDSRCGRLREALAERKKIPAEHIIAGNGAADLFFSLVLAERPRTAGIPVPAFSEYEQALKTVDCKVREYFLKKENNFRLTEDFLNELSPETDIVFLCSPSNPAGQAIDRGLLLKIADRCEGYGIRLVVDECFIDFLAEPEDYTMEKMTEKYSCLFVVQAFTKIHAIPGLRLGYGITSDEALLERMQQVRQPWSVSIPAQEAGIAALGDGERVYAARELTGRERVRMEKKLSGWGVDVIPSQANFILMHSPYDLFRLLKDRGILIRDCSNYSGLGRGWYRTAVRRSEENDRLLEAVRQICQMEEHRKDKARQEEYSG